MSVDYASGLSDYEHKGVCGLPEICDNETELNEKANKLAELIKKSKHCVVYCGAGLSTAAGIPDFRGPNGVWTLEKKGLKMNSDSLRCFDQCEPTFSHRAIVELVRLGYVKFVVSQNIDGLFTKANLTRANLAELHGNYYVDQCEACLSRYIRNRPSPTMRCSLTGDRCPRRSPRACRGMLRDTILDWEQDLPEGELERSEMHSNMADLALCLGTTMQINPAGRLPLRVLRKRKRKDAGGAKPNKKVKAEDVEVKDLNGSMHNGNSTHQQYINLNDSIKPEGEIVPNGTPTDNVCKKIKLEDEEEQEANNNNLVIVNLQKTRHNSRAQLVIHHYIDRVMKLVCQKLSINVPEYDPERDPTKSRDFIPWEILVNQIES